MFGLGSYSYPPLKRGEATIRVLTLLPGESADVIYIDIQTTILDQDHHPEYEAVSYAWGSSGSPEAVIVVAPSEAQHSRQLPSLLERRESRKETNVSPLGNLYVTKNLATALRYLRRPNESRHLWVDAICIDQQNLSERGEQVERMGIIYSRAQRVVVWLGPEADESTLAIDVLSFLGSNVDVNLCEPTMQIIPKTQISGSPRWAVAFDKEDIFEGYIWDSLNCLFGRSWFTRLWIWQEVRQASSADVFCGTASISWALLRNALYFLVHRPKPFMEIESRLNRAYEICKINSAWLQVLLIMTNKAECSDPRDRIYSLMNLVDKRECIADMKPNYSDKPHKVFQDVVLRSWARHGDLRILSSCEWSGTYAKKPTWVPDWSKPRICRPIINPRACWQSKAEFRVSGDKAYVTGVHVGTVEVVQRMRAGFEQPRSIPDDHVAWAIQELWDSIAPDEPYIGGGDMTEAFCKTIIGNELADAYVPPLEPNFPSYSTFRDFVLHALLSDVALQAPEGLGNAWGSRIAAIRNVMTGRSFLTTKEGHIGIAPEAVVPGDRVCIILGCQSPLLLRAEATGGYEVVGECYIHGIMNGEGLLGPFPAFWERVDMVHASSTGRWNGFVNRETGETRVEDPRLGPLPPGWRIAELGSQKDLYRYVNDGTGEGFGSDENYRMDDDFDPRMTAQALTERGVKMEHFELV